MGCVPSKARREHDASLALAAETAARQREEKAAANSLGRQSMPRVESRVMRAASMYEKRDEAARSTPALVAVDTAAVGVKSRALLDGFEAKEAAARRVEELRSVEKKDVRASAAFASTLGGYEEKDAKAKAEPRLEKTFVQKERESNARVQAFEKAAQVDVVVPSVHA
jgi:hypothetical protein